ncbi:hypothetical protein [Succinimonas sp.]|uniref:hypothetical protein n=1 Tax=Succinimonas sp. TaxID=1936151 RepID=UPI0038672017
MDNMCNLGQALFDEGYRKGFRKGFKKGFVKTMLRVIRSNVKNYNVTEEQAMANLGIPENEYEEYNKLLEKEGLVLT